MKRYAKVAGHEISEARIARYLPANYEVLGMAQDTYDPQVNLVVIGGEDNCGWTLDGYVIPRLASGLWFAHEIALSDPVMKSIPDSRRSDR